MIGLCFFFSVNQLGLLQQIDKRTRIQASSQYLIDHIYVYVIHAGILDIGLSHHCLVYMKCKFGYKSSFHKPWTRITYLDWKHWNTLPAKAIRHFLEWYILYLTNSYDSMLIYFTYFTQNLNSNIKTPQVTSRFVKSIILTMKSNVALIFRTRPNNKNGLTTNNNTVAESKLKSKLFSWEEMFLKTNLQN